jgi:hypothetical protein
MSGKMMTNKNDSTDNRKPAKKVSWKVVIWFLALPIVLNFIFLGIVLTHFNTFNGSPFAEELANTLMYVGNWPNFLLRSYPYVIAGGDETVYEALGWTKPITFIINLVGWGLIGFITSYVIQRLKKQRSQRR